MTSLRRHSYTNPPGAPGGRPAFWLGLVMMRMGTEPQGTELTVTTFVCALPPTVYNVLWSLRAEGGGGTRPSSYCISVKKGNISVERALTSHQVGGNGEMKGGCCLLSLHEALGTFWKVPMKSSKPYCKSALRPTSQKARLRSWRRSDHQVT